MRGHFIVRGTVVGGAEIGRTLGFPTANITIDDGLEAPNGVYAARVTIDDHCWNAMANLGVRPTFSESGGVAGAADFAGGTKRVLEIHLFDFTGDIYGRELTVELGRFIRSEQKFATPEALRNQIARDEKTIKNLRWN
jgi:riboflavin kinase/FMN adenylyltransferase